MRLRVDRLNCVPLDRATSTSGKFVVWFLQRFQPGNGHMTEYAIGISRAASNRLIKLVNIGFDNLCAARDRYEEFKRLMTERPGPQETDISMFEAFQGKTRKELPLPKLVPVNGTAIVEEILDEDSTVKRAQDAGLHIPDEALPQQARSTRGRIVAMSVAFRVSLEEQGVKLTEGSVVWFGVYAGVQKKLAGRTLRTLFAHEITDVEQDDDHQRAAN